MLEVGSIEITYYQTVDRVVPYLDWFYGLKSLASREIVVNRLTRIQGGNFGDCKSLKGGIYEPRIHLDQGFRIYFGKRGEQVIVLLVGGEKKTQQKDIVKAKKYWQECKSRA